MKASITKLKQLERYVVQLEKWVRTGRFASFSAKKRKRLKQRIERLQRDLAFFGNSQRVKKAFTAAAVVLGLAIGNHAEAQQFNFKPNQVNPFGLSPNSAYFTFPTFGDLDGDGDFDMLAGEYDGASSSLVLKYYENTGTVSNPVFAAAQVNPFGIAPISGTYFSAPQLVDIDNDGDLDILAAEGYGIRYYQNTGTSTTPTFAAPINNTFGLTNNYNTTIAFGDLDDDGDLDVILGEYYYGNIEYYENTGTANAPAFSNYTLNPFGLAQVNTYSLVSIADVDGDGDLDIAVGEYYGKIQYFENTGTKSAPACATAVADPFGITIGANSSFAAPTWADIDKDGDLDLFAGVYSGGAMHYQEQNQAPVTADTTVSTLKNNDYTFANSDFIFTDADDSTYTSIEIVGSPSQGTLNLMGNPVAIGDAIAAADIPNLVYSPVMDEVGIPYDSLQYRVFDGYLMSDTGQIVIDVQIPVNTDNQTLIGDRIIIAPNPVQSDLNIYFEFTAPKERARLTILDNMGRVVHSESLNIPEHQFVRTISTNKFSKGVYFIRLENGNEQIVKRFVKQ